MTKNAPQKPLAPLILTPEDWQDYQLLDSGDGRKLEAVGGYRFIRPERQALWSPALGQEEWQGVDGEFISSADLKDTDSDGSDGSGGRWQLSPNLPPSWPVRYDGLVFDAMPTPFRHLGFFPEQSCHWRWCAGRIKAFEARHDRPLRLLNLFAYSGVASLHAAKAGAEVTHVDSSKKAIGQAFANRDRAGLEAAPIRFITEDARSFVKRELRRERSYDGIILDPPKYGRGTKGEVWRLDDDIAPLLCELDEILSPEADFAVLTCYAIRTSFLSLHGLMDDIFGKRGGAIDSGELAVAEASKRNLHIGQAIFSRWSSSAT